MSFKKVLTILLAFAIAFGLAAATNTKSSYAADPITIGVYLPMTGSGAEIGAQIEKTINIALDRANAEGGVNGRDLKIIIYDTATSTEGAQKAAQRLVDQDEVLAILGDYQSGNNKAVAEYVESNKVLHVGLGTATTWPTDDQKYSFRGAALASGPINGFCDAIKQFGCQKIAILLTDTDYGKDAKKTIDASVANTGAKVVFEEFYQGNTTDFVAIIAKALNANPDGIVIYPQGTEPPQLVKQIRQQGYTGPIFTSEVGSNAEIIRVGGDDANGIAFSSAFLVATTVEDSINEPQKEFLTAYFEKYGELPTKESAYRAYDSFNLIVEALRTAENPDNGESIRDAFVKIDDFEGIAGTYNYTAADGEGLSATRPFMILDQKVQNFDIDTFKAFFEK